MSRSRLSIWLGAARPQTLPAAAVPVMLGASLAWTDGLFGWAPTLVALFCAFLIQIGTNFANDYFDHRKGADTDERVGFERATATGAVSEGQMKGATLLTMGAAFVLGLYLVWHAGWVILLVGVLSLVCGVLYTGGPWPLGYHGLGDLFVFIFFGGVAVMGTYYVNALRLSEASLWASLAAGALAVNILVVNNLRDIVQDAAAGKRTLGVIFGERALRYEYLFMLALAFAVPPHFFFRLNFNWPVMLPLITFPIALWLIVSVWTEQRKANLNRTLERTAQFMALFGALFCTGLLLG
ncbi:MAG: 1,4-dihydroxy-2-naphthoate polyprenyltransferase [Balneolaceae bacterium]|nr:1,4-dihydroxy-2-naphthoate polyprenyltransferase [Balneolaceae bacterium]